MKSTEREREQLRNYLHFKTQECVYVRTNHNIKARMVKSFFCLLKYWFYEEAEEDKEENFQNCKANTSTKLSFHLYFV